MQKLYLFDVDNTITSGGGNIENDMIKCLDKLIKNNIELGIVAGGEYDKVCEQLGDNLKKFKYIFTDCGSVVHINNKKILEKNMLEYCDKEIINKIISQSLSIIDLAGFDTEQEGLINIRKGSIFITPISIHKTIDEKNQFIKINKELNLINKLINNLHSINNFDEQFNLAYGELGFTIYPKLWDKSQILEHIPNDFYKEIYFFADRTYVGGIDYLLYSHEKIKGVSVKNYKDTIEQINLIN